MESLTRTDLKSIKKSIYVLNPKNGKNHVPNQLSEAIKSKIISRKQVCRLLDRLEIYSTMYLLSTNFDKNKKGIFLSLSNMDGVPTYTYFPKNYVLRPFLDNFKKIKNKYMPSQHLLCSYRWFYTEFHRSFGLKATIYSTLLQ